MRSRHPAITLAFALLVVASPSCSKDTPAQSPASTVHQQSALCRAYAAADWSLPSPTADDSIEEVETKSASKLQRTTDLANAAPDDMREAADAVVRDATRSRETLLQQWRAAGNGHALEDLAHEHQQFTIAGYIEQEAFDDPKAVDDRARRFAVRVTELCVDRAPLAASALTSDDAPGGEILAVPIGSNEIRRFSPTGDDLGSLDLPGVEAPISNLMASPDGRRVAFLAGRADPKLWTLELATGELASLAPTFCFDWADNQSLWDLVGTWTENFIANIDLRGGYDPASRIEVEGCPYRSDDGAIVVHTSDVDGEPTHIARISAPGDEPTTLAEDDCNLVSPRVSPDGRTVAITAGCSREERSGLYIVASDGAGFRQLVSATAATSAWSPDGDWLAVAATRTGGTDGLRVLVTSPDGGTTGFVTPVGYGWPAWVPGRN